MENVTIPGFRLSATSEADLDFKKCNWQEADDCQAMADFYAGVEKDTETASVAFPPSFSWDQANSASDRRQGIKDRASGSEDYFRSWVEFVLRWCSPKRKQEVFFLMAISSRHKIDNVQVYAQTGKPTADKRRSDATNAG